MRTNPDNLKAILSDPGTATLGMMTAKRKGYLDACHDALLAHEMLAALEAAAGVLLESHPDACDEGAEFCSCDHANAYRAARNAISKAKGE